MTAKHLSQDDLHGYEDLTQWITISVGEGHEPCASREEAIASATDQADSSPDIIIGVYQLIYYASARVQPAELFEPQLATTKGRKK